MGGDDEETLNKVLIGMVVPSCLASLSVICTLQFIFSLELRNKFAFKLVYWMTVCDFFCNLQYAMPVWTESGFEDQEDPGPMCIAQAALSQVFYIGTFMWNFLIALSLFTAIVLRSKRSPEFYVYYHAFAWGMAILFTAIPWPAYGYAGGWCWIDLEKDDVMNPTALRIGTFYAQVWIVLLLELIFYLAIARRLRKELDPTNPIRVMLVKMLKNTGGYPLALMVAWTPPSINRLSQLNGSFYFSLAMLQVIFMSSQGLLFATVFYCNPTVRHQLWTFWQARSQKDAAQAGGSSRDTAEIVTQSNQMVTASACGSANGICT